MRTTALAQGEAALADIARHPSTAKFIATKFARHFVADDPPPALVARLQDVFRKTDGDLRALATALVDSDEAWQAPLTKLRSPYEFLVATGRLLARIPEDPGPLSRRPQSARPAAVVAGRAERISRYQCGLGRARGHEAAARHLGADRLAPRRQHRSARSAGACRGRCGVAGNAADHRARGIAAAGAGAVVDVAGIPEEMTPWKRMDCCESLRSPATSRRALLLGGASFAAWAYLPKFARAADGRDPRLIVVILRGALDGLATVAPVGDPDYAGLHGSIALTPRWPACGDDAGFVLRAASLDAGIRADVSGEARRRDSCGVDAVSRPFAFRRPGRARKRLCRAGPGAVRLAQPRAGSACRAASG